MSKEKSMTTKMVSDVMPTKTAASIMARFTKAHEDLLHVVEREKAKAKSVQETIFNLQNEVKLHEEEANTAQRFADNLSKML